jgi:hypothetical protein
MKLFKFVIYDYLNKPEYLPLSSVRPGAYSRVAGKAFPGTNALTYYKHLYITEVKSFITIGPVGLIIKFGNVQKFSNLLMVFMLDLCLSTTS